MSDKPLIDVRLTTRCPHCDTAFRVYEHQLERRDGQVRCGACGNVFDAYDTLETNADPLAIDGPPSLMPGEHADTVSVGVARPTRDVDLPLGEPHPARRVERRKTERTSHVDERPARARVEPRESSEGVDARVTDDLDALGARSDYLTPDAGDYDFGPPRPRGAARWLYPLGAIALTLLLIGQALYWFRDEIAARFPPLEPALAALCQPIDCAIELPRVAERLKSSSDLLADRNLFVLTATIRNDAAFTQAFPTLELTLRDGQEQPLVKRVITPKEYLEPAVLARRGITAGGELPIRVQFDATGVNASGYQLFVFYPPPASVR